MWWHMKSEKNPLISQQSWNSVIFFSRDICKLRRYYTEILDDTD